MRLNDAVLREQGISSSTRRSTSSTRRNFLCKREFSVSANRRHDDCICRLVGNKIRRSKNFRTNRYARYRVKGLKYTPKSDKTEDVHLLFGEFGRSNWRWSSSLLCFSIDKSFRTLVSSLKRTLFSHKGGRLIAQVASQFGSCNC
jgi:hypothetical protein